MTTKDKIYLIIIVILTLIVSGVEGKLEAEEDRQSAEICRLQDTDNEY